MSITGFEAEEREETATSDNNDQQRVMQGSRRSSTHSVKVLYRQDQAVNQSTGNLTEDPNLHNQK